MTEDSRTGRAQSTSLNSGFYSQDLHKSMFIKDLKITLPTWYVESWGKDVTLGHSKGKEWNNIQLRYTPPKSTTEGEELKFTVKLRIFNAVDRRKESSYRLTWKKDLAIQLAKDYPQSFVRSLEYQIGDSEYKKRGFAEYDIGGFKEQVQIRVSWKDPDSPVVQLKELFRVKEEVQLFPNIYKELGPTLIAEHLIGNDSERLRRPLVSEWRERGSLPSELKENVIYLLAKRSTSEFYIGETKNSLSARYPKGSEHHSWQDWDEYCVIQLPPGTSSNARVLMERVLIEAAAQLFGSDLKAAKPIFSHFGVKLKNLTR
jgi:hypothetical protein